MFEIFVLSISTAGVLQDEDAGNLCDVGKPSYRPFPIVPAILKDGAWFTVPVLTVWRHVKYDPEDSTDSYCWSWQLAGWWKFVLLFYSNSLLRQMDDDACHELIRFYWCVYVFGMGHCMDAAQALVRTVQRGRKLSTTRMRGKQLKMTLVSHLFEAHFELFYSTLMVPILVEWILEKERERERERQRGQK